jgi:ABC-type transport system involved in Fe-S cluster assembly fused permease/ATPase subunit
LDGGGGGGGRGRSPTSVVILTKPNHIPKNQTKPHSKTKNHATLTAEYAFTSSLNALNVMQSAIMFAGMSGGILLCTAGVSRGTLTVGDTVLFLTLMAQLYGPLNFFGTYYRVIQQYMIDMENLLAVRRCGWTDEDILGRGSKLGS